MLFSSRAEVVVPGELAPGGLRDVAMDGEVWRTTTLNRPLSVVAPEADAVEHIMNSAIFMQAWRQLHEDGRFKQYAWTVKADPDTVFFGDRVRALLQPLEQAGMSYIRNCDQSFGFYGALEVVSREAVEAYVLGEARCRGALEFSKLGEDLWLKECFDQLGFTKVTLLEILEDAYCAGHPYPCKSGRAAFHPFKAALNFVQCTHDAMA